jgi:hypothetical protein
MKVMIKRTSEWDDEIKPCGEAFKENYTRIDERSFDEPVKIPFYNGNKERAENDWYGSGRNHRTENGRIKRDFDDVAWFIEINSLEELFDFVNKYKEKIVFGTSYDNKEIFEIEIYDSYRE